MTFAGIGHTEMNVVLGCGMSHFFRNCRVVLSGPFGSWDVPFGRGMSCLVAESPDRGRRRRRCQEERAWQEREGRTGWLAGLAGWQAWGRRREKGERKHLGGLGLKKLNFSYLKCKFKPKSHVLLFDFEKQRPRNCYLQQLMTPTCCTDNQTTN